MRIDFFARRTHFVDHLLPVWEKIPWINRGKFYVPDSIASYVPKDFCVLETCKNPVNRYPPYSENPMVVCAYGASGAQGENNVKANCLSHYHG